MVMFAYPKCQCTSSLLCLWRTVLNELGGLLNKAVIRSGLSNSMFPQFLCAEPAGLVSGTQDRTAWDKLLSPSRLIQSWRRVGRILRMQASTNFCFPFCSAKLLIALTVEKNGPVLHNQILPCWEIIEMLKCENPNDFHLLRNIFTSTNENVPVALAIRSAHLSSAYKIVSGKCESGPKQKPFLSWPTSSQRHWRGSVLFENTPSLMLFRK